MKQPPSGPGGGPGRELGSWGPIQGRPRQWTSTAGLPGTRRRAVGKRGGNGRASAREARARGPPGPRSSCPGRTLGVCLLTPRSRSCGLSHKWPVPRAGGGGACGQSHAGEGDLPRASAEGRGWGRNGSARVRGGRRSLSAVDAAVSDKAGVRSVDGPGPGPGREGSALVGPRLKAGCRLCEARLQRLGVCVGGT